MRTYRAYLVDGGGDIQHASHIFESLDDEAAIAQAKHYVDGCAVEIWDHDRMVALIGLDGVKK